MKIIEWTTRNRRQPRATGWRPSLLMALLFALALGTSQAWAGLGDSQEEAAASAAQILIYGGGFADGVYWIDPDGTGGVDPFQVYCDMTTSGGGWMLAVHSVAGSEATDNDMAANTGTPSLATGHTRNLSAWAVSQSARIWHYIEDSGGAPVLSGYYTGAYHDPLPSSGWTILAGSLAMLNLNLGMSWGAGPGFPTFGAEWYFNSTSPYSTSIPSMPIDGLTQGPIQQASTPLGRYSIYVRELTTPAPPDSDGDGAYDFEDNCPGFDDNADADADGVPDGCDACPGSDDTEDADADGVPDGCDVCPGADDTEDADTDGVPDGCDVCPGSDDAEDADADGVPDGCDVCPGSDDAEDADGDGVPDGCDVCPGSDDAEDADADGVPDGCDACPGSDDAEDADGDGVPDGCDVCPGADDGADADGDSVPDGCDTCPGADDTVDTDTDGVADGCDNCPNTANPLQTDSDSDGIGDVCELPAAGVISVSGQPGFIQHGQDLEMYAPSGGSAYQWQRFNPAENVWEDVNEDMPRVSGTDADTLVFTPVFDTDSGRYKCVWDNASKALVETGPYDLVVLAEGSLPATTLLSLGLLGAMLAGGGCVVVRRYGRRSTRPTA